MLIVGVVNRLFSEGPGKYTSSIRWVSNCIVSGGKRAQTPRKRLRQNMKSQLPLSIALALSLVGCLSNPEAKKQKFYSQGVADYEAKKYPEAVISLGRAVQIDPKFADAHFKLA